MPKLRVLIADDDPIIRLDLRQMLQTLDYEVVAEAGDGATAVELARSLQPDVCILDVRMPVKDGIEAVAQIVHDGVAAALLLTAYGDRELVERASEAGAFGYLVKPFKPGDLPPALEIAYARFQEKKRLQQEAKESQERLETRVFVDRAKALLMKEKKISEEEAHHLIQQMSMNSRRSLREIAQEILSQGDIKENQ